MLKNPPFCFLLHFELFQKTPFNNKSESSRDFTILIISSIPSFDIINTVLWEAEDEGQL